MISYDYQSEFDTNSIYIIPSNYICFFPEKIGDCLSISNSPSHKKNMVKNKGCEYIYSGQITIYQPNLRFPEIFGDFPKLQPTFWGPIRRVFGRPNFPFWTAPVNQSDSLPHRWHPTCGPVNRRALGTRQCVFFCEKNMEKATFKKEDSLKTPTPKKGLFSQGLFEL